MSEYKVQRVLKETAELPSGFGFYPKGTKVWFSPMTTEEVEILNESEYSSKLMFEHSLQNITTEKINREDLTFNDFIFICLQRRLYSQTEIRCTLSTSCHNCGKKITDDFDFGEIDFETPKDSRLLGCQIGDFKIVMGPLTIGAMLKMMNSEKGVNTIDTMAHCIRRIHPLDSEVNNIYSFELARDIIANSWGEDREVLGRILEMQDHGLKPRKIKCSNCQTEWEEDLGNPDTLIFPRNGLGDSIGDKIYPC